MPALGDHREESHGRRQGGIARTALAAAVNAAAMLLLDRTELAYDEWEHIVIYFCDPEDLVCVLALTV